MQGKVLFVQKPVVLLSTWGFVPQSYLFCFGFLGGFRRWGFFSAGFCSVSGLLVYLLGFLGLLADFAIWIFLGFERWVFFFFGFVFSFFLGVHRTF